MVGLRSGLVARGLGAWFQRETKALPVCNWLDARTVSMSGLPAFWQKREKEEIHQSSAKDFVHVRCNSVSNSFSFK